MSFTSAFWGVSVGLLIATSPAVAQCVDADGDHYYAQAGCGTAQDCDDANATVYPGAPALCDGLRNDCNGPLCDGAGPEDCDQDSDGFTPCEGDCDDSSLFVSPGGVQACDGINNDCDDPLWPALPAAELDGDGDDFPTCTGSCEVRVTTEASLQSTQAGPSYTRSIVAIEDGFVVAYKQFPQVGGQKGIRAVRLDTWGRRVAGPIQVDFLGSSNGPGNPIVATAGVGFGIAWERRPLLYFQLLGNDLSPIGSSILIDDECAEPADAELHGVVWNGYEFALAWTKYCDGIWGIHFGRVGSDGHQIGTPIKIVNSFGPGTFIWNGNGYALAWVDNGSLFIQKFGISGTPDGAPVLVGSSIHSFYRPSLVWTGSEYAVAWNDDRSGNDEIYLARFDASLQRLDADSRLSDAIGASVAPQLIWTGEDYRASWINYRTPDGQVYIVRAAKTGEAIGPPRRISAAQGADSLAAAWSGSQAMMVYSADVPSANNEDEIFAARESCHDCADNNSSIFPGASQICDRLNNDCNDATWPTPPPDDRDTDGDGRAICDGDCDDSNGIVHPGANETCDALDDDCNGQIDEDPSGVDSDGDGVHNACDNCRFAFNTSQLDSDGDTVGSACDNCPLISNTNQADLDSDTRGNVCDNCPAASNVFQDDNDGDRVGDACDNCVFDANTGQSDFDHDNQGDLCDVNDGLIYIYSTDDNYREWQAENGYSTWRSYRGSLASLRATGQYTQAPGSNSLAARNCGLTQTFVFDVVVPTAGTIAFNLVTGVAGGIESSLGTNSAGVTRPNANPCP